MSKKGVILNHEQIQNQVTYEGQQARTQNDFTEWGSLFIKIANLCTRSYCHHDDVGDQNFQNFE